MIVCVLACEREGGRERGGAPEPEGEGPDFFQDLCSGAGGCFMLDAVENTENHRVHPLERPGQ